MPHDVVRGGGARSRRLPAFVLCMSALMAGALSGCEVGPDFLAPAPPETKAYTPEGEPDLAKPAAGAAQHLSFGKPMPKNWWSEFRSPDLDRVMAQAIADSPTLAASTATLAQAHEAVAAAAGGLYPRLDLGAGASRQQINRGGPGFPRLHRAPLQCVLHRAHGELRARRLRRH